MKQAMNNLIVEKDVLNIHESRSITPPEMDHEKPLPNLMPKGCFVMYGLERVISCLGELGKISEQKDYRSRLNKLEED